MGRIATIGVYGFTAGAFLEKVTGAGVGLLLDLRQRRGVRGPEYAWANSARLQLALAAVGVGYRHVKELAPTTELRRLQYREDDRRGVGKRNRVALAPEYAERYVREVLDPFALGALVAELPGDSVTALLCVERDPEACHRSLVAQRLRAEHGLPVWTSARVGCDVQPGRPMSCPATGRPTGVGSAEERFTALVECHRLDAMIDAVPDPDDGPDAVVVARETIELAFLAVVQRFVAAAADADPDAFAALLAEHARQTMPPLPYVNDGRAAVLAAWREVIIGPRSWGEWRCVPVRLNLQRAYPGCLRARPSAVFPDGSHPEPGHHFATCR